MKRALLATAAILAAVVFFLLFTLPPAPRATRWTGADDTARRTVAGAFHVHTSASDGSANRAAIAEAARRAGLAFVIVTDHGDGTRTPAAPEYINGVLCLDGVEISTTGGHYAAVGMNQAPYPLGGEPGSVVEDVMRLGDSLKRELAWSDWTLPIDGLEWINIDSEWRDETRAALARTLFNYLVRPGPAMASILDRPVSTLTRWDQLSRDRSVAGLPGHDAHGGIGGADEGGRRYAILGVPSYEASFRAFSLHVMLDAPPSGAAGPDARRLLESIRARRAYTVLDGLAAPGILELSVREPDGTIHPMGSVVRPGPVRLSVRTSMPEGADLVILQNGAELSRQPGDTFDREIEGRGAVRVEVQMPGAPGIPPVPWLVSNPIYFLEKADGTSEGTPDAGSVPVAVQTAWHVEKDPASTATLAPSGDTRRLDYRLMAEGRASQFVALAADLGAHETFGRVAFSGRASGAMRVSVQLRYPASGGGRWGKSVFLDTALREVVVPVDRLRALDRQERPAGDAAAAGTLLFVVDLTNARPGDSGAFEISDLRFTR
jgi:hypothetical protein